MTRRDAVQHATLLAVGACLGTMDCLHAEAGQLTVNLNQWSHIVFTFKNERIVVPMAEVFEALRR